MAPRAANGPRIACNLRDLLNFLSLREPKIALGADIVTPQNLVIDHDVTIDLSGHSIISEQSTRDARVFDIRRGAVILTGEGKVFAMGKGSTAVRISGAMNAGMARYSTVNIGSAVHLYAPDGIGLEIFASHGAAYGVAVDFGGEIVAHTGISLDAAVTSTATPLPTIRIRGGAHIIADETNGIAVHALGLGDWQLDAAELCGDIALFAAAGHFELHESQLIGNSQAIRFQPAKNLPLDFAIDGGAYLSETDITIVGRAYGADHFIIRSGDFCGAKGVVNKEIARFVQVEDGNFSTDPDAFWANLAPLSVSMIAQPEPAAQPEPIAQPEPVAPVAPITQLEPEPRLESVIQPEPVARPEPTMQPEPAAQPEPIAQPEPVAPAEPALEFESTPIDDNFLSDDELDQLFYFSNATPRRPIVVPPRQTILDDDPADEAIAAAFAADEPTSYDTIASYAYGPMPKVAPAAVSAPAVTMIDEQTPRPIAYRSAPRRPAPRSARPVATRQPAPASSPNIFYRIAMGFHAGFDTFRNTRTTA